MFLVLKLQKPEEKTKGNQGFRFWGLIGAQGSVGGSTRRGGAVVGKGGWRVGAPVGSVGWRSSVGGLTCEGKMAWGRARQRRGGAPDLNKKHADCDGSGSGLGSVGGRITQ